VVDVRGPPRRGRGNVPPRRQCWRHASGRRRAQALTAKGALPTFVISIHPSYAAQLFETNLAEGTPFGRDLVLRLSREHVYYRGCGWAGGLRAPARLLWYVKGTARTGTGYLAAASALLEVSRGRPRSLHQRFARLGVWSRQEVEQAAGKREEVTALRFADTELFARPLGLHELRETYSATGLQFQAPQSPRSVPEHMFCLLYQRASSYAT
jgi:predicted transcriptional regulator